MGPSKKEEQQENWQGLPHLSITLLLVGEHSSRNNL